MAHTKIRQCSCRNCQGRNSEIREYHRSIIRVMLELDERSRRLFAGLLARQMGRGGITRVHEITGISRVTIRRGASECESGQAINDGRIRCAGGGRIAVEKKILELLKHSTNC